MSDIKDKLESLLANRGVMSGTEWQRKIEDLQQRRAAGEFEIHTVVDGKMVGDEQNGFYLVRTEFPLETVHGNATLGAALEAAPEHIALSARDDDLSAFDATTAVFIDAETTGLAGGAGTVAFLVGAGYFVGDVFRLEQCFMRDYDDEEPMLEYLNDMFRGRETVVSYNGKSFDMPLLQTRFVQNRIPFRLAGALHFDLVHAARRFWRRRLGDCSLSNIERVVLGLERHGDVPSHEIPDIWFEYLRTRDARRLPGVFYHHRMDILSLVALTAWLARCLEAPDGEGFEHFEDRLSLVRLHFVRGEYHDVVSHGERLLEVEETSAVRLECIETVAMAHKRLQDFARMAELWSLLLEESPEHLTACIELAKHHEHRTRNLAEAERLCREAVQHVETREALGRATEHDAARHRDLVHRLARIQRKLDKGRP
jgi:uncharacterized protein YprB with RNaseH-like and TPR domain